MSLREQFEAWFVRQPSFVSFAKNNSGEYRSCDAELAWQAYQAGHAVNADLLEALESMLQAVETMKCPQNIDDAAMLVIRFSARIDQSRAAIKKARAE